jgi:hypothetical protein
MIIGIDNGLDGGLCAISRFDGSVVDYTAMPCYKRKGKREIDTVATYRWITDLCTKPIIAIEEPLKHARSSQAMRSMAISFGKLFGMCEVHGLEVAAVDVKEWQDAMLGKKVPRSGTKTAALAVAQSLHPNESWLAGDRSRIPHDGIVDGFLIAEYLRRKN